MTDALMFTWEELCEMNFNEVDMRIVRSWNDTRGGSGPAHSSSRLPADLIHLSDGKSINEFAEKFMAEWKECRD